MLTMFLLHKYATLDNVQVEKEMVEAERSLQYYLNA